MNSKALILAILCAATIPAASGWAEETTAKPAKVQELENAWHDAQSQVERGAASQADVLAARVKLAEARIREEQQAIVAARQEQLTIAQKHQQNGAASAGDVAKADAALREAQLAMTKD